MLFLTGMPKTSKKNKKSRKDEEEDEDDDDNDDDNDVNEDDGDADDVDDEEDLDDDDSNNDSQNSKKKPAKKAIKKKKKKAVKVSKKKKLPSSSKKSLSISSRPSGPTASTTAHHVPVETKHTFTKDDLFTILSMPSPLHLAGELKATRLDETDQFKLCQDYLNGENEFLSWYSGLTFVSESEQSWVLIVAKNILVQTQYRLQQSLDITSESKSTEDKEEEIKHKSIADIEVFVKQQELKWKGRLASIMSGMLWMNQDKIVIWKHFLSSKILNVANWALEKLKKAKFDVIKYVFQHPRVMKASILLAIEIYRQIGRESQLELASYQYRSEFKSRNKTTTDEFRVKELYEFLVIMMPNVIQRFMNSTTKYNVLFDKTVDFLTSNINSVFGIIPFISHSASIVGVLTQTCVVTLKESSRNAVEMSMYSRDPTTRYEYVIELFDFRRCIAAFLIREEKTQKLQQDLFQSLEFTDKSEKKKYNKERKLFHKNLLNNPLYLYSLVDILKKTGLTDT